MDGYRTAIVLSVLAASVVEAFQSDPELTELSLEELMTVEVATVRHRAERPWNAPGAFPVRQEGPLTQRYADVGAYQSPTGNVAAEACPLERVHVPADWTAPACGDVVAGAMIE